MIDIIIIAAAVIVVVLAVGFIRMLMDGRRLREKRALHMRRIENSEREELFSGERNDDSTHTRPTTGEGA